MNIHVKLTPVRFGTCMGCGHIFFPGPYFVRRVRRHLRLGFHNHDAVAWVFSPKRGHAVAFARDSRIMRQTAL